MSMSHYGFLLNLRLFCFIILPPICSITTLMFSGCTRKVTKSVFFTLLAEVRHDEGLCC